MAEQLGGEGDGEVDIGAVRGALADELGRALGRALSGSPAAAGQLGAVAAGAR
jgi:hypothetical protein